MTGQLDLKDAEPGWGNKSVTQTLSQINTEQMHTKGKSDNDILFIV